MKTKPIKDLPDEGRFLVWHSHFQEWWLREASMVSRNGSFTRWADLPDEPDEEAAE